MEESCHPGQEVALFLAGTVGMGPEIVGFGIDC